jgi:hypothetical protein
MVAFLVFCLVWSRFKGLPGEISTSIEKFVMYGVWDIPNAQELKYDYSPLTFPPRGICLVELQPSSDGAISITLISTKLQSALRFDAPSYTWGIFSLHIQVNQRKRYRGTRQTLPF